MNFDNSKRKVLKLQFRSFFVVVENSRAVKLLVKHFHISTDEVFAKSSVQIKNTVRGQKFTQQAT